MRVVEVKLTLRGALTFELDSSGAQRPPFLVAALTTMHLTKKWRGEAVVTVPTHEDTKVNTFPKVL